MQLHLNGFKPGNYQVPDAARKPNPIPPVQDLPSEVDVLIVGTGPAGLTMARQMSEFADIKTCIVDMALGPLLFGRADGISCRMIEIMEAFNSSEMVVKETYHLMQNTFWEPDAANPKNIKRTHKIADARVGLSEFTHGIVNQARLNELLLDGMSNSITNLRPHYSRELVDMQIDESLTLDLNAHPITATFKRTDDTGPDVVETVKARFVVGSDGGRSRVRKSLGITLEGDTANKAWGVMDILLNTDFPDIRVKSFIQSKDDGAVMTIPREGGYLIRFYVEMDQMHQGTRASDIKVTERLPPRKQSPFSCKTQPERLFDYPIKKDGKTDAASKAGMRTIRKLFDDPRINNQSFRHTFTDAARTVEHLLSPQAVNYITGHKKENSERSRYGSAYDIKQLYDAMCAIDFNFLSKDLIDYSAL